MASYGYGPPPAPPPTQPQAAAYPQYSVQSYPQAPPARGGHRGGRGGHHQTGHHQTARVDYQAQQPYGYNTQPPQPYAQQAPTAYTGVQQPLQNGSYPQQWQHEQAQGHTQPQPPHASLPPQNYHPNYAPQIYQQQPYGQQPAYTPPAQPPFPPQYAAPAPPQPNPLPAHQWGPPAHTPQNGGHFGGGRGRGGHHHDRGGSKAQIMGPPIRLGFEGPNAQDHTAPVSSGYPVYGAPQGGAPAPYPPGPYQGYPAAGPPAPVVGAPQYDPYFNQGGRFHPRGGFHNNSFRGRAQFGGDKMRHKKPGASNVPTPNTNHQKPDAASAGKKKKRKTNTLGLTPGEDSDDDDADEESKLLELIGPDAPNPTDLAAWIAERRKNFPTQARVRAKLAEATNGGDKPKADGGRDSSAVSTLEKQQQKAERLRKQLEKVESSIKRKREQQDEGDEMRDVDASTSVSSESKSDDEGPESLPVRPDAGSFLPPPPKKADPSKHCKYFSTGGICGKKGKCRFVHDEAVREAALREREMNGGRMTLQQRLTLNDKDQEDLTIVKTLQYLKEKGAMKDCSVGSAKPQQAFAGPSSSVQAASSPGPKKSYLPPPPIRQETHNSLPPQPPPSVLLNPPSVRYQGWNLSGFGNTGVKSSDL